MAAYFLTAQFWILSSVLNNQISTTHNYISDLFLPGQPHALLFRVLEICNGIILLILTFRPFSDTVASFKKKSLALWLARILAVLTIIDAVIIDSCLSVKASCDLQGLSLIGSVIHGLESIASVIVLLGLTLLLEHSFKKYHKAFRVVFLLSLLIIALQLAGPYAIGGKGTWQRVFTVVSSIPIGLLFIA